MNLRGAWAPCPENTTRVNVTSAQRKDHPFRLAFSPMTPIVNKYKGFYCFENYWQSGKRYPDIPDKTTDWWKKQTKGKRRYPDGKNKKVLYAKFPHINDNLVILILENKFMFQNTMSLRRQLGVDRFKK